MRTFHPIPLASPFWRAPQRHGGTSLHLISLRPPPEKPLTPDLPLDLRYKKTRAIRRRLTHNEKTAITEKQHKRQIHFPQRKYALKA